MNITGQFSDFYGSTMLPALKVVINNRYKRYPDQFSQIFNVQNSTKSIEQYSEVTGMGLFASIDEGERVRFDSVLQGFDKTFTHSRFGLGFRVSQDLVEDDKIGLITKMGVELGRSCKESIEIDAAGTFNNGFDGTNYPGPDGKALFATDHPLIKSGGVQSNTLAVAADLDYTSLQLALTDFETQKDSSGKYIHVPASKLIYHPTNRWTVMELLKSTDRPDTANRATNTVKYAEDGMPTPFAWRYLTDTDSWYLSAPPEDTGLVWFWRRAPYTKGAFDDQSEEALTMMRYKKSHGWHSFTGVYGSPGA